MERGMRGLFLCCLTFVVTGLLAVSCDKKDAESKEDPYALEDELARLAAYRQVHYPAATALGSQAFFQEIAGGTGAKPERGQWVRFDLSAQTLDHRFVLATESDTAKYYSHFQRAVRYAPIYRACTPYALGRELFEVLQGMKQGATVVMGMSSPAVQQLGLISGLGHTSLLFHLTLREVVPDPSAREEALIAQYTAANPGFARRQRNDTTYYVRTVTPGKGAEIKKAGRVYIRYAAYALDGFLFDTNDAHLAQANGRQVGKTGKALLLVNLGNEKALLKAFSGIFPGHHVGDTFELVVPSSLAYGVKGKGAVQPYEPLRFWVYVQNYLE